MNDLLDKYPTKLDRAHMTDAEWRKQRTLELYDYLPQTSLEDRYKYTDIRDAVIDLNYTFFGYIASHKFINNSSIDYSDKLQTALLHFCRMWHKFKFAKQYRTDLSFSSFFMPRVGERIEELNEVKYSLRRTMCMKVGDQLNKHWAKVTYDDLKLVDLPPDEMASLQAMFGSLYIANLDTHELFIESDDKYVEDLPYYSDDYDTLTDMLIHEMVTQEKKLSDKDLLDLAMTLDIPYERLKQILPDAEQKLYQDLQDRIEMHETFKED